VPDPLLLVALLVVVLLPAALLLWRPSDSRVRTWARGSAFAALAVMLLGNAVESFFLADVFRLM
jgi:hypothetical protein